MPESPYPHDGVSTPNVLSACADGIDVTAAVGETPNEMLVFAVEIRHSHFPRLGDGMVAVVRPEARDGQEPLVESRRTPRGSRLIVAVRAERRGKLARLRQVGDFAARAIACTSTLPSAVASIGPANTASPVRSAVSWHSSRLRAPPPTMWSDLERAAR